MHTSLTTQSSSISGTCGNKKRPRLECVNEYSSQVRKRVCNLASLIDADVVVPASSHCSKVKTRIGHQESTNVQQHRTKTTVHIMGIALARYAESGNTITTQLGSECLSFHTKHQPDVSVGWYLERLLTYLAAWYSRRQSDCGMCLSVLYTTLAYVDRVCTSGVLVLRSCNVHRIVLAAFSCALKFLEDVPPNTKWFSLVGGVRRKEMIMLEREFLRCIDWKLTVNSKVVIGVHRKLLGAVAQEFRSKRLSRNPSKTFVDSETEACRPHTATITAIPA